MVRKVKPGNVIEVGETRITILEVSGRAVVIRAESPQHVRILRSAADPGVSRETLAESTPHEASQ